MQSKRAAIYARFSTDLQNDRSVDDQIDLCREFAAKSGFVVARTYFDKARTGASIFGRDGLLSLMDDAKANAFDVVVVEALDRLSRDQEDLPGIYKRLTHAGVEIIAVHDGAADAIQIGIRGLVSTLFLADLKNKIRRGMTGVIKDGRHAGGRAYGYRPTPGQPGVMQIHEPEAEIVRRIYAEVIAGRNSREIAGGLNRDLITPPRGATWNSSTICGSAQRGNGIIRNPLYAGRIIWNRIRMVRDPETGKRVSRPNPQEEWREADAPHLALVDTETYETALAIIEGRATRQGGITNTRRPKRLLSGILRCEHCGGGMSIHDRHKDSGAIRIRCSRATESGACTNERRYRLDKIEAAVISGLKEQLAHPELLAEYVRVYREERRAEIADAVRDRAALERKLLDLNGQLDRLMQALTRGVLPIEVIEAQYKPLEGERDRIKSQLATVPQSPAIELHPQAFGQYKRTVENLAARLNDLDDISGAEVFTSFRELVHSVVIRDRPDGRVEAEVIGHLSALIGDRAEMLGGRVVAEEGFEPPTQGL